MNSNKCKNWLKGDFCGANIGPEDKSMNSMCWASFALNNEFNACFQKVNGIDRYKGNRRRVNRNNFT